MEQNYIGARTDVKSWGTPQKYRFEGWDSYLLRHSPSRGSSKGTIAKSHLLHSSSWFSHLHYHVAFLYSPMPASKCGVDHQLSGDLSSPEMLLIAVELAAVIHSEAQETQQANLQEESGNLGWADPHYHKCGRRLWDRQGVRQLFHSFCPLSWQCLASAPSKSVAESQWFALCSSWKKFMGERKNTFSLFVWTSSNFSSKCSCRWVNSCCHP